MGLHSDVCWNILITFHGSNKYFLPIVALAKAIKKAGKNAECGVLLEWKNSIINHLYWSVATSPGNAFIENCLNFDASLQGICVLPMIQVFMSDTNKIIN